MGFHQEISKGAKFVPRAGGAAFWLLVVLTDAKTLMVCSLVRKERFCAIGFGKLQ